MLKKLKSLLTTHRTHSTTHSGFTMIELMIVIAIIGALGTMFMSTFPASQKRGRDTKRKSDIKQYQTALELYANKKGDYAGLANGTINAGTNCSLLGITGTCPDDPKAPTYHYILSANSTNYVLSATLEQPNAPGAPYFVVCSTGKSGENATNTGPTCPLP